MARSLCSMIFSRIFIPCDQRAIPDAIDELPLVNSPEVFGLHPNAEIGYFTQAAKEMWLHLVELQPQTGKAKPENPLAITSIFNTLFPLDEVDAKRVIVVMSVENIFMPYVRL
uniref:Uncharacterized protein n=1 Tax=Timema monikensis TaxID=170555 RepID=A0A7R9ELQ0_9NEOP|nr:unnamed protein product [Timema monikensis]